jgi:hypothetical protein
MSAIFKAVSGNAARQRRFRAKAVEQGWVQCDVWIPAAALPDLKLQAEVLREHPHLTVGPLRRPLHRQVRRPARPQDGAAARRLIVPRDHFHTEHPKWPSH